MRLFIAEKPSVAKAIAVELGVSNRADGYIECRGDIVTWCFGHMLEQVNPDHYTPDDVPVNSKGRKIWRVEDLPIIPENWVLKPKKEASKQLKVIAQLLKKATTVVNAGDPDREGQLLVDELLDYFKYKKETLRYWSNAIDPTSIQRALSSLSDNAVFKGLAQAAEGRSKADWLMGMNLSRAYTLRAHRGGSRSLLTVGRVQTPTLALVVNRDREIECFKPIPFFTIKAEIQHSLGQFWAYWKPQDQQDGLDSEGRLIDAVIAQKIASDLSGSQGRISSYQQTPQKELHPLMYSLSAITAKASKSFGYSAEDVLKICQSLYETHKLTTYPRTDCPYLPESQFADAVMVLKTIKDLNPSISHLVDQADPTFKSRVWNDNKVTAHHGIIPTMHNGDVTKLNPQEKNIYDLILHAYIAQFYPLHEFMKTEVSAEFNGEIFCATGKVVTMQGWCVVNQSDESSGDEKEDIVQVIPNMRTEDPVKNVQTVQKQTKTKAPPRFTEGTLITAMVNIHRFVTDSQSKKMLRDGDGIGTEATRASIISELKKRGYLETKGKSIISTSLGQSIIDALPEVVKSPVLTALFERMLKGVESGQIQLNAFIKKQAAFIQDQVQKANSGAIRLADSQPSAALSDHVCKMCSKPLQRRPSKHKNQFWWGCSGFPECKQTYRDLNGVPVYLTELQGA